MQKDIGFYYKKSRLNQIRGFCSVVQSENSIIKASKKTGVESATISKQVRTLENDLGVQLFDRSGYNKLKITPEGDLFFKEAIMHLNGIDNMFDNFNNNLKESRDNNLKVATIDAVMEKIIPFVAKFKNEFPQVNITILNLTKYEAFKELVDKKLDVVLYPSDIDENLPVELERKKISNYTGYWVLYKGHELENRDENTITREEISKYPFGLLPELEYVKSFGNFLGEYDLKTPINLKFGTINTIKKMIREKMCMALMNETYLTDKDKKDFVLKGTLNSMPQMFYYSFSNKNAGQKNIAKEFLKMVEENKSKIFH